MKKLINSLLVFNLISISSTYVVSCKSDTRVNESLDSLYAFNEIFNKSVDEKPDSPYRGYNNIFFDRINNDDKDEEKNKNDYFIPDSNKGYSLAPNKFYSIKAIGKKITKNDYNEPNSILKDKNIEKKLSYIYKYQVSVDTLADHLNIQPLPDDDVFYNFSNITLSIEPSKTHYDISMVNQVDKEQTKDNRLVYTVNYDSVDFLENSKALYSVKIKIIDFINYFKLIDFSNKNIVDRSILKSDPSIELVPKKINNENDEADKYKLVFNVKSDDVKKISLDEDVNNVRNSIKYFISSFDTYSSNLNSKSIDVAGTKKEIYNLNEPFKILNKENKQQQISQVELDYAIEGDK